MSNDQIPNPGFLMSKVQIPNPNEIPISNDQIPMGDCPRRLSGFFIGHWSLGFHWDLGFGHWDFPRRVSHNVDAPTPQWHDAR
jgi:hypothetical protein